MRVKMTARDVNLDTQLSTYSNGTIQAVGPYTISLSVWVEEPNRFADMDEINMQAHVIEALARGEFSIRLVSGLVRG